MLVLFMEGSRRIVRLGPFPQTARTVNLMTVKVRKWTRRNGSLQGALSAAEKQRRYRARRDADPERREKYLLKEKENYKKDLQSGKRKNISQVSAREHRQQRRKWRETFYRLKERKRALQEVLATPPHSPEPALDVQPSFSRQRDQGQKTKYKLMKQNDELHSRLKNVTRRKNKYKKQVQRLKRKNESPRTKVNRQIRQLPHAAIRKTLFFHHVLIENIRNKYRNAQGERERQIISKVITGQVMKKYRLQRIAQASVGFSNRRWQNVTDGYTYQRMRKRGIGNYLVDGVRAFYERDDVSRITTGKKQTITVKKTKKQKRFLFPRPTSHR
ncbi:uncharacterized protein LOC113745777 [Larimichthys crocea]|uniref:uncharacterized protein LOC113745777 n=1 Tax=Larimichthys crocea TaxID=215358 RepID=UPI000F5EE13E|nr:uncharacterized protein LOC113745777 [Larimichthys crocea]